MSEGDGRTQTASEASRGDLAAEQVLEISPTPMVVVDAAGFVVQSNERARSELGLQNDELLGLSTRDTRVTIRDEDGNPVASDETVTARVLQTGERQEATYHVDLPSGEEWWLSVEGAPVRGDDGTVDHVAISFEDVGDRKERERRFDAVFNNTYQFTGLMEPDGTLIEANETALAFGGLEPDDVIGEKLWDAYWFQTDDETPARLREDVARAASGEFVRYELEVRGAEGPAVIDFSLKPIRDERGEVSLIVPEGRNITDLKRREEELREERAFTESMLSGLPDALYAFDGSGNFLRWNSRLAEVTGYSDEEIADLHPLDFVPDDEATKIAENIAAVVESGETVTVESYFETKTGERIPYEFTGAPLIDQEDNALGLVGIGRDISDRKERERRFAAVFDNTYQFTGLMEPDGTLVEANETAVNFAGVDREDVVGRHLADTTWITEENRDRVREAVDRCREGEFVRFEMEITGEDGPAVIDFSLKPVTDETGAVSLLIPEGRDITELKEREAELAEKTAELERTVTQLERTNAELEQFAYVASHDLQEPLRMISSYLDLLEMEYREVLDEEAEEYIDFAVDGADRMREMVDDLLAFSRVQTRDEEFEPTPLEDVVEDAKRNLTLAIEETDATVACDDLPAVPVDTHQLRQLVQNLLENAINYAGDEPPRVHVSAEEHGDSVELVVADEGVGIPEEEQDRIFDIFMRGSGTADEGGSGIGLAICKRVAENHGGRIWVDSEAGEGTEFHVTLSRHPQTTGGETA